MANTKVTKAVLADDAVGLAQLDITNDPSDGQALTAEAVTDGYNLKWATISGGVDGISSSADATAITIDSSEQVGIGTTSPSHLLHLKKNANTGIAIQVDNTSSTSYIDFGDSSSMNVGNIEYIHSSDSMNFKTNSSTRLTIASDGDIGIGTTSPSGEFHVESGQNPTDIYFTNTALSGTGYDVSINALGSANNSEMKLNMGLLSDADRDQIKAYQGNLYFRANNNQRYQIHSGGKHTFYGTHQGDNVGHFLFTNNGFDGASVNNSLVVENGNSFVQFMAWAHLGCRIGTRTGGWSTTGNQVTYLVSGDTAFAYGSGSNFYLGSGTAITSDERLKKNISSTADGQLAKINQLRPVSFDWKDERKDSGEGFIAQEVEQVIPEAVTESEFAPDPDDDSRDFEGDVKSVREGVILSRLVKAVQELSAKNDALEARIETLESN